MSIETQEELSFLNLLSRQEQLHFRNLTLIRPQLPTDKQLQLIEGLARNLSAPRLLTLIARTPHWLIYGPILQALAENEHTPEAIRRDLEMAVSLFDMMRELDQAPTTEKDERSETVKAIYQQLRSDLKPIVKAQAKQMARQVHSTGTTAELPPLPTADQDWEALTAPPREPVQTEVSRPPTLPKSEMLLRAASTHQVEELCTLLMDPDAEIRSSALHNPIVTEEILASSLQQSRVQEFFDEVYGEARWYFRDAVRSAIRHAPASPSDLCRKLGISEHLLYRMDQGSRGRADIHRIVSLFTQLDESEYQYITLWAKRSAPNMLRVVKHFYDRLQRRRSSQASGFTAPLAEGRWASLEDRVFSANQATAPEQLLSALIDPDFSVFLVVLENPGLSPKELLASIPSLDQLRAERLSNHQSWGQNPAVQEALVHNIHLSEHTALRLLANLQTPRTLLDVLRDPRIPHMEVKSQAQSTLRALYLTMDISHRIIALRSTGGELIRYLPTEILQDETALTQLVADRQLDPSILLRLARNKQTPRNVLALIAQHPIMMAHPPIMSELLLNPKTPRDSAIRIWGLLSESEQQQLLKSPHLPATLRNLA